MLTFPRPIMLRTKSKRLTSSRRLRFRPQCEVLEDRLAPASTITVTTLAEGAGSLSGGGSSFADTTLRGAVKSAEAGLAGSGPFTIQFAAGLTGNINLSMNDPASLNGPTALVINANITINGNPGIVIQRDPTLGGMGAGTPLRLFLINAAAGNLTLNNLTLQNGLATNVAGGHPNEDGAAIDLVAGTLAVNRCVVTGNASTDPGGHSYGAGLYQSMSTTATVNYSTFSNNNSNYGGAITTRGTLTVNNCTISNNTCPNFGGGGLTTWTPTGPTTVINSTITGNKATSPGNGYGGGICNGSGGKLYLTNCTVSNNTAYGSGNSGTGFGGGGIDSKGTSVTLKNTIVAGNTDKDLVVASQAPDIAGTAIANFCLVQSITGWTPGAGSGNNLTGMNPMLGALQTNGGPTQTMALQAGSPAIDAGSNALVPGGVTTDQRGTGFARIINGGKGLIVDIGAYEFNPVSTMTTLTSSGNPTHFSLPVTFTATVTFTSGGSGPMPGTVTFTIDGAAQAPVALNNGVTTLTTSTLTVGSHTVTAQFNGINISGTLLGQSSAMLTQIIDQLPVATFTTLTSSRNPLAFGQNVTFAATVTDNVAMAGTPSGTLTFFIDGVAASTVTLSNGKATFTPVGLSAGPHTVTAQYNGQASGNFLFSASSGSVVQRVVFIGIEAVGSDAGFLTQVNVYDKATGKLLDIIVPFGSSFTGGARVAVGDVNGDGVADIIVGAGPGGAPEVNIYDGRTFQLITTFFAFSPSTANGIGLGNGGVNNLNGAAGVFGAPAFTGGVYVAAGDVNGDGFADIIVGAGPGTSPQVQIFDGKTGSLLTNFFAFGTPFFRGGVRVAAGDVNGDGFADILLAAGPGGGPQVEVIDGRHMQPLFSVFAFGTPSFSGGVFVGSGDVLGAGYDDIIVGAGGGGGPQVEVFDGMSQAVIANFFAFGVPSFGGGVRVAGLDITNNGRAAILAAAGPGGNPQLQAVDGLTLAVLTNFFPFSPGITSGVFVG
jgi:hypothetical protein